MVDFFLRRRERYYSACLYELVADMFSIVQHWEPDTTGPTRGRCFENVLYRYCDYRNLPLTERAGSRTVRHGDLQRLDWIQRQLPRLLPEMRIFIVQPGLDRDLVSPSQLDLLGTTELYLKETYGVGFGVIGYSVAGPARSLAPATWSASSRNLRVPRSAFS